MNEVKENGRTAQGILSMDATDIRAKLRTATAADGSLVIIGAEEAGSQLLALELELTDKTRLQQDDNSLTKTAAG